MLAALGTRLYVHTYIAQQASPTQLQYITTHVQYSSLTQSMHPQPDSTHALNQTWGDVYAENLHFTYAERINSSPIFTVQLSNTHFTTHADA